MPGMMAWGQPVHISVTEFLCVNVQGDEVAFGHSFNLDHDGFLLTVVFC